MVVLPCTGASRYNCCIDGGTSLENFGYHLVHRTTPLRKYYNFACTVPVPFGKEDVCNLDDVSLES
jgi:hypothetical protein